jgi:hypothetical protein
MHEARVDANLTAVRLQVTRNDARQRRFAGAIGSDQRVYLAGLQRKTCARQRDRGAEALPDVSEREQSLFAEDRLADGGLDLRNILLRHHLDRDQDLLFGFLARQMVQDRLRGALPHQIGLLHP